jgi:hypothetical protein
MDILLDILRPMAVLISQPWLALIPAVLFVMGAVASKSRAAFVVAVLWLLYCLYEFAMKFRIMCSGECNIRIDLLLLYPLLLVATLIGLVTVVLRLVQRPG